MHRCNWQPTTRDAAFDYLSSRLFSDQNDIARGVVNRNVGDEEPATGECLQSVDQWRGQEQQTIRFVAVEHLAFELETLHRHTQRRQQQQKEMSPEMTSSANHRDNLITKLNGQ